MLQILQSAHITSHIPLQFQEPSLVISYSLDLTRTLASTMNALVPWPHDSPSEARRDGVAPITTFYTPKFDGFPWDESLLHDESPEERDRRIRHEQLVEKQIRSEKRQEKYSNLWRSFRSLFCMAVCFTWYAGPLLMPFLTVDDDSRKVKRIRGSYTVPFIPGEMWRGSNLQVGQASTTNIVRRDNSGVFDDHPINVIFNTCLFRPYPSNIN